jgi:hypothetical protein
MRHNIWIPDDLWALIQQAAADEGARRGQPISIAEWIRAAILARLEREEPTVSQR